MKHAKTPRSLGKVSLQTSRKSAPISAFILAGALALSACEQAPSDLMGAAKEAMAAGQQRDAMLHLSAAVSAEPDNTEARFLLGKVSLNQGNLDRAATELERIGAETEFYAPAQILLAETYQLQGNMRRARQTIDALPLETPEAYKVAVTFALSDGQIDQAMGQIDEGLARFPDASELIALDAQRLWRGGNPVAAAERLETALTDPEASFEVHLLAGQIALSERAQDKAKGHFSKVLEMRPSQQAAMLGLAAIARDAGDDQTAKEWLAKASASDRAHPMAVYFAAQMAYDGGDLDQAYNLVQAMPPELSSVPQVARLEGFIASARGNSQNAISAFERYLARGEGDPLARRLLAENLANNGEMARAWDALEPVIGNPLLDGAGLLLALSLSEETGQGDPARIRQLIAQRDSAPNIAANMREAGQAIKAGDWAKADAVYAPLVNGAGKNNPMLLNNAAAVKSKLGQHGDAVVLARRALAAAPQSPEIMDTLGWALWQSGGNKQEARALLEQAIELAPSNPEITKHYAAMRAQM